MICVLKEVVLGYLRNNCCEFYEAFYVRPCKQMALFFALIILFAVTGPGCAPKYQIVDEEVETIWFPYLQDGKTTKEDVLLRLGLPTAQFEGEKILTYRLMLSSNEGLVVVSREIDIKDPRLSQWARAEYSLILVFNDQHILKKHSLLRVR